jgi:hypothetical protein
LIWVLKLGSIRDNAEFHEAFHALASYSACLTNWYFRLSRRRGTEKKGAQSYWDMIVHHSAFAVYGLPLRTKDRRNSKILVDEDLADIEPNFFLPESLPIALGNHRQVRKHREQLFSFNVSVEADNESVRPRDRKLNYWLLPDRPKEGLEETAETTGLPVFDAEMSPGSDFDLAFHAIYEAAMYHLGFSTDARAGLHRDTLEEMGWQILTIDEFQNTLLISKNLSHEPS